MFTSAVTLHRGVQDIIDPQVREIGFGGGPAQVATVDGLRYAWTRASEGKDIASYMRAKYPTHLTSKDERVKLPDKPDLELDSPWKEEIYDVYKHLFWDISGFIQEANYWMGHYHPPDVMRFPLTKDIQKTFEHNVLLLPAYLRRGTTVKLSMIDQKDGARELGSFDASKEHTLLFLRRDMPIDFRIEHDGSSDHELAAVMVFGNLCIRHLTEDLDNSDENQIKVDGASIAEPRPDAEAENQT